MHGLGLASHKLWTEFRARRGWVANDGVAASIAGWVLTNAFVCVGWVFFRSQDFATAWVILRKLGGLAPDGVQWLYLPAYLFLPVLAAAHYLGVRQKPDLDPNDEAHTAVPGYALAKLPVFAYAFVLTAWLLLLYLFVPLHRSPFIYFQF